VIGVAILLAAAAPPAMPQPATTYRGGWLDGMRAYTASDGSRRFMAGAVKLSPPPAARTAAAARLVSAARVGHVSAAIPFTSQHSAAGADALARKFASLAKSCRSEPAYAIDDDNVRLNWVCAGKLEWLSLLHFSGDSVDSVSMEEARVPVPIQPVAAQ
jgi:hypothetical protein